MQCKEARTRPNQETLKRATDIKKKGLHLPFVILHTAAELSMGAFVNLHVLVLRSERRKASKITQSEIAFISMAAPLGCKKGAASNRT